MKSIYLLQHVHEIENDIEDIKIIGAYSSELEAQQAIYRLSKQPGFREYANGFTIDKYIMNKDNWKEGFVTNQ